MKTGWVQGRVVAAAVLLSAATPLWAVSEWAVDGGFPVDVTFDPDDTTVANAIALQPDGKILLAGYADIDDRRDLALARLLTDGSPDPQFSADGKAQFNFGSGVMALGGWVGAMADGRVVAVTSLIDEEGDALGYGIAVVRLLSNGTPDTTFSLDGRLSLISDGLLCSGIVEACSVVLLEDGGLLIAAIMRVDGVASPGVLKLRPDGSFDPAFGVNGVAAVRTLPSDAGTSTQPFSAVMRRHDDGRLLLAVNAGNATRTGIALLQLRADGTPDAGFGGGAAGMIDVGVDILPAIHSMHLGNDGRVTLGLMLFSFVGSGDLYGAARFRSDGTPDPGFGSAGIAAIVPGLDCDFGDCPMRAMHVDRAGRPYLIGEVRKPDVDNHSNSDVGVARFTAQGQLDTDFAPDAVRTYGFDLFGGSFNVLNREAGHAVVQDGTGRLVIAGQRRGETNAMQVWRIHTDEMFRDTFE